MRPKNHKSEIMQPPTACLIIFTHCKTKYINIETCILNAKYFFLNEILPFNLLSYKIFDILQLCFSEQCNDTLNFSINFQMALEHHFLLLYNPFLPVKVMIPYCYAFIYDLYTFCWPTKLQLVHKKFPAGSH